MYLVVDISVQAVGYIFKVQSYQEDCLILENGSNSSSRNVYKALICIYLSMFRVNLSVPSSSVKQSRTTAMLQTGFFHYSVSRDTWNCLLLDAVILGDITYLRQGLHTDWDVYLRTFLKIPAINKIMFFFKNLRVNFVLVTKSHVMRFRISVNKSPRSCFLGTRCGLVARFTVRLLYFLANNLPSESGLATETHRTGF
jgi:hypothetical protein